MLQTKTIKIKWNCVLSLPQNLIKKWNYIEGLDCVFDEIRTGIKTMFDSIYFSIYMKKKEKLKIMKIVHFRLTFFERSELSQRRQKADRYFVIPITSNISLMMQRMCSMEVAYIPLPSPSILVYVWYLGWVVCVANCVNEGIINTIWQQSPNTYLQYYT